jgi:MoaA/NifB/PqqE/SkfB family radical SAM enzyme
VGGTEKALVLEGYHHRQELLDATPDDGLFYLSLNLTSHCNYRCPYCFVGHANLRRGPDELALADKLRIVAEASSLGARVIVMPGRGEPTADRDFLAIVEHAQRLELHVVVDSNIQLLDEARIERLAALPVSIFVKADALEEAAYERSTGSKGTYRRFRDNVDLLLDRFPGPRPIDGGRYLVRLGFNAVITSLTRDAVAEVRDFCSANDIYFTCRSPVRIGEAHVNWDWLAGSETMRLRALGQSLSTNDFTSTTEAGHCGIYRFGITVENNGDVYVCPQSRVAQGNLKEQSLAELLRLRLERGLLNKEAGYCFAKDQYNPEGAFTRSSQPKRIDFATLPS